MKPNQKHRLLSLGASSGAAALLVGAVDGVACGCGPVGALLLGARITVAGLLMGGMFWFLLGGPLARGRKWTAPAVALLGGIPWGIWLGGHLASTPTLRNAVPAWILMALTATALAAMIIGVVVIQGRFVLKGTGPVLPVVALLVATMLVLLARETADLHKPLAVSAAGIAISALALPLAWVLRLGPRKLAVGLIGGCLAGAIVSPFVAVGLEDSFEAGDRGAVVDIALGLGRVMELPAPETGATVSVEPEFHIRPGDLPSARGRSVVLISVDALRPDHLGYGGYQRPVSPFLDSLATESVVFGRAYSASPASSISIPSLVAGRFMEPVLRSGADLPPTSADRLAAAGYRTMGFYPEKVFSAGPELMGRVRKSGFGFEKSHILEAREAAADLDFVRREIEKESGRPLFLWVHLYDPHLPYNCHDEPFGKDPVDCYDAEIRHLDEQLGRFIPWLRRELKDPVLAITADHGEAFGEHGRLYHSTDLYDEQIRVPMLVQVPGMKPGSVRGPISNTWLVGMLEALVSEDRQKDSRSVGAPDPRVALVREGEDGTVYAAIQLRRALIDGNNKLICNDWPGGSCALYDLSRDPGETRNLAGRKSAEAARLMELLRGSDEAAVMSSLETAPSAVVFGRLGRRDVAPQLVALASDPAGEFAPEAARLLAMMRDPAQDEALEEMQSSGKGLVAAWACVGSALLDDDCQADLLVPHLEGGESLSRWAAVALGRMEDERALAPLKGLVKSDDPGIRAEAALALGVLGDSRAVPVLMRLLDVKQTRWAAIEALAEIGDPRARKKLERLMLDEPDESNMPRYRRALESME